MDDLIAGIEHDIAGLRDGLRVIPRQALTNGANLLKAPIGGQLDGQGGICGQVSESRGAFVVLPENIQLRSVDCKLHGGILLLCFLRQGRGLRFRLWLRPGFRWRFG